MLASIPRRFTIPSLALGTRCCTYRVWVVLRPNTLTVEEESYTADVLSLTVAEGVHELSEGGGALDLEEHLVVVIRDLDVQVLALTTVLRLLLGLAIVWRTVVGHIGCGGLDVRWSLVVGRRAVDKGCLVKVSGLSEAMEVEEGANNRRGGCFIWCGGSVP
jgi:hypothetical protein